MASTAQRRTAKRVWRKDESIGLTVAVALHAAVLAALLFSPGKRDVVRPPERISVTLSDEVGETSTSPDPNSLAAPDKSPDVGEPAPAPAPEVEPAPAPPLPPQPAPRAIEEPRPTPPREQPKAQPRPAPKPVAKAPPRPTPPRPAPKAVPPTKPTPRREANPIDQIVSRPKPASPAKSPASKAPPAKTPGKAPPARTAPGKSTTPPRKTGSTGFDAAFTSGKRDATDDKGAGRPASAYGATERASFAQALLRQVKPKWQGRAPEGVNTDKLITILSVELNKDGSLARKPTVVRQEGIDDSNRAQAARHAEEAVRAVELAAPFSLPADDYEGWKKLPPLRFRKSM